MGENDFKDLDLKEAVSEYFKGVKNGYSSHTLEAHRKKLTERFGITDFAKLKIDFVKGEYQ